MSASVTGGHIQVYLEVVVVVVMVTVVGAYDLFFSV
jgi:hypothetical protein